MTFTVVGSLVFGGVLERAVLCSSVLFEFATHCCSR